VTPDLAPVREVVEADRTALLFASGDAEALARALGCLVADPLLRERLGREARRSVAAPAGWSHRARALLALAGVTVGEAPSRVRGPARLVEAR
jgi:glycosyltransferase involved in cell wall biosynthesis